MTKDWKAASAQFVATGLKVITVETEILEETEILVNEALTVVMVCLDQWEMMVVKVHQG